MFKLDELQFPKHSPSTVDLGFARISWDFYETFWEELEDEMCSTQPSLGKNCRSSLHEPHPFDSCLQTIAEFSRMTPNCLEELATHSFQLELSFSTSTDEEFLASNGAICEPQSLTTVTGRWFGRMDPIPTTVENHSTNLHSVQLIIDTSPSTFLPKIIQSKHN